MPQGSTCIDGAMASHCQSYAKHLTCWNAHKLCQSTLPGACTYLSSAMQQMQSKRQTLMDSFEYVMFGRIFKYEDTPSGASNQVRLLPATAAS